MVFNALNAATSESIWRWTSNLKISIEKQLWMGGTLFRSFTAAGSGHPHTSAGHCGEKCLGEKTGNGTSVCQ